MVLETKTGNKLVNVVHKGLGVRIFLKGIDNRR